jgi:2-dehydro-3-deoxyphosphogluconate aldolase/(4S)-4-hydroxy-2-oxoglutarate aldolase
MEPARFVETLWKERASAILRTDAADRAAPAMEAAIRGGFRVVELTLTTPGALELVRTLARRGDVVVGAGTVLRVEEARRAVDAGATFLVSPVVDEAVIEEAAKLGVASIPGAHTPTEMVRAHRAGAPLVKLFPAPSGGPDYLRTCLAPLPFLKVVPTSGVDESNVAAWIEAGAWGVGLVASLFVAEDVRAGRYDRIEERARRIIAAAMGPERRQPRAAVDPFG